MSKEMKIRVLYVILIAGLLLFLVSPFVIPIIFAATIALTLNPGHELLIRKGMKPNRAAALLTTLFAIIISIPVTFFVIKGTTTVTKKLEELSVNERLRDEGVQEIVSDIRHDFVVAIHKYSSKHEFLDFLDEKKIDSYLGMANTYLLKFFQNFLAELPTLFILLLIMILCTYSFLTHSHAIKGFFQKLTGFSPDRMEQLVAIFIKDSRQVYMSNIVTGSVQSLLVAVGVSLLGIGDFFLVFFITLILSFIPVVGAAPVAFLCAILAFLKGNTTSAIILLVLGGFAGLIDNFLRPWLASFGESKIPPIVAFVCVIGGALWLGFPGLFIGLLIGSYAYDTLPIFWEELDPKK